MRLRRSNRPTGRRPSVPLSIDIAGDRARSCRRCRSAACPLLIVVPPVKVWSPASTPGAAARFALRRPSRSCRPRVSKCPNGRRPASHCRRHFPMMEPVVPTIADLQSAAADRRAAGVGVVSGEYQRAAAELRQRRPILKSLRECHMHLERSKASVPLSTTSPMIEPVVPPFPICNVPP